MLTVSYGRPPWIALIIAASWSTYGLLKRRVDLGPVESLAGETFLLVIPAVVLVLVTAGHDGSIPSTATGSDWVFVALTGVVTATPLLLFAYSAQRVPFTLLGALQYLVPTINLVLGWAVYGEDDDRRAPVRLRPRVGRPGADHVDRSARRPGGRSAPPTAG